MINLEQCIGEKHRKDKIVSDSETAIAFGSGSISVFSTPNMIGLMENTSMDLVQPLLDEGYTTVGTSVDIKHLSATPIGMKIVSEAEIVEVDGRKLVFKVTVWDKKEKIGEGIHERFIVNASKFMEKALLKSELAD